MNLSVYLLRLVGLVMALFIIYALTECRYPVRKTIRLFIIGGIAVAALNFAVFALLGERTFIRLYPLTGNLSVLVFMLFLSRQRWVTVAFNILTAIQVCAVIGVAGYFASFFFTGTAATAVDIAVRVIVGIPIIYLIYRYFRPAYLIILKTMRWGWGLLCAMPFCFYAIFYVLFMRSPSQNPAQGLLVVTLALVMMMAAYGVIFFLFREFIQRSQFQEEQQLLTSQVQALSRQVETIQKSDEQVRIYRHDMRHYIAEVATLLQAGNVEEALKVLGGFDQLNQKTVLPTYCKNPTVNAILAYYFQQAEDAGIEVEAAECHVPLKLPVEAAELAMVLANALENAIHACGKLAVEKEKKIAVRILCVPNLVMEVANTYDGEVQFDNKGLPVAKENGHGIGTRSIFAFVEKYDAVIDYKVDEAMFRIRLLVNNP